MPGVACAWQCSGIGGIIATAVGALRKVLLRGVPAHVEDSMLGLAAAYLPGLGLAAGATIFVVFHEMIPETHRNGV